MAYPVIVIAGDPVWLPALRPDLAALGCEVAQPAAGSYMTTLIDQRAALVLVDGAAADWERWLRAPKASPATRRIPLVLVSSAAETRAHALRRGADLTFDPAALARSLPDLLQTYARIPDAAALEQLACGCAEPLPPLAEEGLAQFNAGAYYAQHDLFEAQWVQITEPVRDLYRAILQVGVAYYQIERGNYRGALKMLQRSVQWLLLLPDVCQGINVAQLRADSFAVRAELERLGEARFFEFDRALIKPVQRITPE